MTLNVVGESNETLTADWFRGLNTDQRAAYVRYQYYREHDRVIDWDLPPHSISIPKWDGGRSAHGHNNGAGIWKEIVMRMADTDAICRNDAAYGNAPAFVYPGLWVVAHFSPVNDIVLNSSRGLTDVTPYKLCNTTSASIYFKYLSAAPAMALNQWNIAADTLALRIAALRRLAVSDAERTLYALFDESYVNTTPFFRHALAVRSEVADLPEDIIFAAAIDYDAHQPLYDHLITKHGFNYWLSDALIAQVRSIRAHWQNYSG